MEPWLIRIANYLLAQSWQIAVLTVVVALATFGLRNRSAHVRYLLWLIVLAKALVPPLYSIPLAVLPQDEPLAYVPAPPIAERMVTEDRVPEAAVTEPPGPASVPSEAASLPQLTRGPAMYDIRAWLAIGWLAGVVALSLYYLANALRTQIWLQRRRKALPGESARNIESFFAAHGVRRMPRVWLLERISQPFVWGLVRGSIYLPANLLDDKHAKFQPSLLGHELSHIIRLDAMVNSLQVIAQTIFWFHPFVWWANAKIRAEREKCCHEMTIARLNTPPEEYGEAIVETLAAKYEQVRPVPSLAVAGQVKNIEERIKTMLRPGKKFYRRPTLVAGTVVLLVALLTVPTAPVLTARSQTATQSKRDPTKSLYQAAADGDVEQAKSLFSKGTDVNKGDRRGNTPLHYAAMSGDKQTIELLLSKGADINAKNRDGRTPLFEAMKSSAVGRKEVVELLVSKSAKLPAFHLAAYVGDMEKLKKFLEEGVNINTIADCNLTALHAAANSGEKDVVEFLVNKGANIDARDLSNLTPLYYAAIHNYEDIVDLLLARGADINAKGRDSYAYYTLLNFAIWDHNRDAIELLISKGADINAKNAYDYTPLFFAMWENDRATLELLISKGANVNAEDKDGRTPYYWAVMQGRKDMVEFLPTKGATPVSSIHLAARAGDLAKVRTLIEDGADVNAKDKASQTPLFWAVLADNNDVAKFLIAKGADVNAKDALGRTPLNFLVYSRGKRDMVELLISKGADVNAKDSHTGVTPLHSASFLGQKDEKDIVELLIAEGSNVNARTNVGVTPLHFAARHDRKDVAELLISKGADINTKDNNGRTALHDSCLYGHKAVVELLIAKGADLNTEDNKEKTPLSLAKEQGHEEIADLLRKHGAKE